MKPIRRERIAAFLRNELAQILQRELHDPRLGFVSILSVSPTEDLKEAEVRVSILGSEADQRTTLRGLESARGYIQGLLGDRLHFRNTPVLRFVLDETISKSMDIEGSIKQAREEDEQAAADRGDSHDPGDADPGDADPFDPEA